MSCLGDVVAALVDGELDHAARERAQRHLAHCRPCRAEVDGQRRLKARLTGDDAEPAPSEALTARLLALRFETDDPATAAGPWRSEPRVLVAPSTEHWTDDPGQARPAVRSRLRPGGRRRSASRGHARPAPSGASPLVPAPSGSTRPGSSASGPAASGPAGSGPLPAGPAPSVLRRRRRGLRRTAAVGSAVAALGVALVLGGQPSTGPSRPADPGTPAFVGVFVTSTSGQSTSGRTTSRQTTGTSTVGGGGSQR